MGIVCLCGEEKSGSCMASSSSSWCAACTFLLGKCMQECVFEPYIPPEDPLKFLMMHKVFGETIVAKWFHHLQAEDRKDAVILPRNQQQALLAAQQALHDVQHPLQMLLPQNHNLAAAISNHKQQEISNPRFSMVGGGGGAGSSVMMPSSSNNPFGAQPAGLDHQNPQVSPAAAGVSMVYHSLLLQQQLLADRAPGAPPPPLFAVEAGGPGAGAASERSRTTNTAPGRRVGQSSRF